MVTIIEKEKPSTKYNSPLKISEDIREFTDRRERRAEELGIALYILGADPQKDIELQQLEDYIMDNYEFHTHESWPIYVFKKMYNPSETTLCVLVFFDSERTLPNVPVYITFNPVDITFSPANMPGRNVIKYFHDDKLLDALKSSFDLVEDDKDGRNYHINPKDGESADNKFILKVLDTFAENSRRPIIKKKQK